LRTPYAFGVFFILLLQLYAFKNNFVFPVITKIILVYTSRSHIIKIICNGNFPAWKDLVFALESVFIGNSYFNFRMSTFLPDSEKMQVIIKPTHGILNRDMQVPERIGFGDENASPDKRRDALERYLELIYFFVRKAVFHSIPFWLIIDYWLNLKP